MSKNLNHLAIILDGNARWAKNKSLPQFFGHQKGVKNIEKILTASIELGIKHLSLFCFSTENWKRSAEEVHYLLDLLKIYLDKEVHNLHKNNIKLVVMGNLSLLNNQLREQINQAETLTKDNKKITLYIAFSYGGRQEIVDACQAIIDNKIATVNEKIFKEYLYIPNMPDVDLLIRTSGEYRISNFLLWQIAYAELYFCKKYWPEFDKHELIKAIDEYSQRTRKFGLR
jgi:undecaprenyl diphosphate synthase